MSITNELKKYALGWDEGNLVRHDLLVIADHIDVKYQKMLDEHDSEQFNALMDARDKGVNAVLKEPEGFGLIALPKDADDKYIHIGDVMESKGSKLLFDEAPFEVWAMQYDDIGWEVYDHSGNRYTPSLLRRHTQTVEDVQAENEDMLLKAFNIIGELLEENVKLRELARDTFGGYKGAVEMLPSSYSKNVAKMAVMDISDRMHELGMEAD